MFTEFARENPFFRDHLSQQIPPECLPLRMPGVYEDRRRDALRDQNVFDGRNRPGVSIVKGQSHMRAASREGRWVDDLLERNQLGPLKKEVYLLPERTNRKVKWALSPGGCPMRDDVVVGKHKASMGHPAPEEPNDARADKKVLRSPAKEASELRHPLTSPCRSSRVQISSRWPLPRSCPALNPSSPWADRGTGAEAPVPLVACVIP